MLACGRGVRLIKSTYVYKLKRDWQGKVTKRKSRLVVQNETYAPVAKDNDFQIDAGTWLTNYILHQLDVDSAFLYADLDEEVFMTSPPGMEFETVEKFYGLKQALEQDYCGAYQVTWFQTICAG